MGIKAISENISVNGDSISEKAETAFNLMLMFLTKQIFDSGTPETPFTITIDSKIDIWDIYFTAEAIWD